MNTEVNNNTTVLNATNTWTTNIAQEFSSENNHMINIDQLISQWEIKNDQIINTNNYTGNTEPSDSMSKIKMIWAGAGILLLVVVSGVFIYMMYPIEFQSLWKSIQWNSIAWWQTWVIDTGNKIIDNKNILTPSELDTWSKTQIDDLFAWKWSGNTIWSDNTWIKLEPDDPNKLIQNPDWSSWLDPNSNILEWLNTGANYGNWDEDSKIELLSQIRAKIEIAKMNYTEAKKSVNPEAMKLIASSLAKYKDLLTKVENNEIVVKLEIQDKMVEIQADIDKAKMLIQ